MEREGDAAAARLLREYRTLVRREVARHAGAEVKTEGDSFYVVFPSASSALECAVAIVKRARARSERHPEAPLRVGIGLHAGETVSYDDQFVGSAVNIASRLASKAQAGEIVISDTLRGLVRTAHSYELADRGPLRLKGVNERVRAWTVRWDETPQPGPATKVKEALPLPASAPARVAVTGQLLCPIVVGREEEFGRIGPLLERARAGSGGAVLVGGEAGIGKTAFVREVEKLSTEQGFRLLPGTTLEAESAVPYAPFLSAIRAGFRELTRDELGALLGRVSPELAALFPEMARARAARAASPGVERHRLAISFQWLFSTLAREAPLVLVLDDLQWADEASLALVEQLARELRAAPALLVGTYRSDELHRRHPLVRTLAALRRERLATEIELRRLDAGGVASLIQYAFGLANPPRDEFRDAIYARAEGNPFFTEELLKSLVESGDVFRTATGWDRKPIEQLHIPGSIREAVRARIDRLPREAQATLEAGAVLGTRFTFDALAHVRDLDEDALAQQLRECIDLQLIVELEEPAPTYEFRHALTREVIYDGLLLPERRRLHLRAAASLEAAGETPPALLAEQWRLGGDRQKAAEAYEAAAQAALALHAPDEAVGHLEAAIEARGEARLEHYLGLARAYLALDVAKARDAAERGLALLPAGADLAPRIELMYIGGRARWNMGDSDANFELARQAVELVEDEPDGWAKARAFEWHANALFVRDEHAAAAEWAQRALEVATRIGDSAIEASALITLAGVIGDGERPAAALELLEDAAAVARRGAPEALARAHINSISLSFRVEPSRARFVRIERAVAFSQRYGYGRLQVLSLRALHRFLGGEWPNGGTFELGGDPANVFVRQTLLLEQLVRAARGGPLDEVLEASGALVARAVAGNEPQTALAALALESVLLRWAGRSTELATCVAELRRFSGRTSSAALALVDACLGLDAAALAFLGSGERDVLVGMADALGSTEGRGGEPGSLRAYAAWLDGDEALALREFSAAVPVLEERGLQFRLAVDLHALASVRPLGAPWAALVARADMTLERAGAGWLREDLARISAAAST